MRQNIVCAVLLTDYALTYFSNSFSIGISLSDDSSTEYFIGVTNLTAELGGVVHSGVFSNTFE